MAEGYHDWAAGEDVTAANLEDYTTLQSVMRFASAAARDTALSAVKTEGMLAFLKDVNALTVYTGSAWSTLGPAHGALTAWTPTLTQSGSVAITVNYATYQRIGRMIHGSFRITATASGTGANPVIIGGIPATAAAAASDGTIGNGWLYDTSGLTSWGNALHLGSTTTFEIRATTRAPGDTGADNRVGVMGFTAGIATGDIIRGQFAYEAASDA